MIYTIGNFAKEERGQDLVEYTLVMALVALLAIALFVNGDTVRGSDVKAPGDPARLAALTEH